MSGTEPIELRFTVDCDPAHAFEVWAGRTATWWPSSHSASGDPATVVTIEPGEGGRIYERTPAGFEHDWGRVLAWEPPTRLVYLWHLGAAGPADGTEVAITFSPSGAGTEVSIVHRGWERLGASGPQRRGRNLAGWGGLLPHYQEAAAQ